MVCHLNSYSRELLNNQTPFSLMKSKEQKKLLELLKLSPAELKAQRYEKFRAYGCFDTIEPDDPAVVTEPEAK